jgi:hypothetical protein
MDASAWIALIAVIVALGALGVTLWSARSAARSADTAEERTKLQQKIHIDSTQLYVWASIVPDEKQGQMLKLVVSNEGPTVATNIKVVFDPRPVPSGEQTDTAKFAAVLAHLESGLSSLPPRHRVEWLFDMAMDFFATDAERSTSVTVDCEGPYGPCTQNSFLVQLGDVEGVNDWPMGTLHLVEKRLIEMTKVLERRNQ